MATHVREHRSRVKSKDPHLLYLVHYRMCRITVGQCSETPVTCKTAVDIRFRSKREGYVGSMQ